MEFKGEWKGILDDDFNKTELANAKIMVAAPELLEALQFCLKILEREKDPIFSHRVAIKKSKKAINKALK